jgi:hypothetical protein
VTVRARLLVSALCFTFASTATATVHAAPKKDKAEEDDEDDAAPDEEAEDESEEEEEEDDEGTGAEVSVSSAGIAASGAATGGMKGRLGLMGTRTISGLNGISARYYVIDKLSLGLTAGFATFHHKEPDENGDFEDLNTVGLVGVGPQFFFWPYQGDRNQVVSADFGVGVRTLVYMGFTGANEDDAADTLNDPIEIDIEIPLTTQLFIGKRVAIAPEFGLAIRIIPGSREPDENGDFDTNPGTGVGSRLGTENGPGLGFELGSTSGMFLGLNVGYYFGAKD